MTFDLKDVGERGIPMSLDFGERCTTLSFDLGERPQILFTGPEWKMDDGPGWDAMHFETDPDWVLSLDGGPGWNPMNLPH
ncbi:hypothetical protein ABE237_00930 [Brevibacillus formosus]|uniref:hypothetical protein n=1 Tax=Brevibacillus formosus TaxID=54913 RepID=UPI0018CF51D4|nr:hypothetical protein [Brevibacillus formosus]MBG9944707.1 hypothetical protein [Brevibacillus formosus]